MNAPFPTLLRAAPLLLLPLALFFGHFPLACADAAKGSLTSFSFHVTDLDLTDGVTPALTYVPSLSGNPNDKSYSSLSFSQIIYRSVAGLVIRDGDEGGSFSDTTADIGFAGASTTANSISFFVSVADGELFSADATISQYFDLTPHTEVDFSANGHAELTLTGGFRSGGVQLTLGAGEIGRDFSGRTFFILHQPGAIDKRFTASVRNNSSTKTRYILLVDGNVGLSDEVLFFPVPEPATYIGMLLGIWLTVCIVRRIR